MDRRILITLLTLIVIVVAAGAAVFLVKGYQLSPKTGEVSTTGIIAITSEPDGASVFLDGHLTSATNATISSLPPKKYDVKVIKEGFISWQKQIEVKAGLVSEVKLTLFPSIPTVYPLTYNGAVNPVLSSDGAKLAFGVPIATESATLKQKGGVYVYTMAREPIAFNRSSGLRQLLASTSELDFSKASLRFSPDSKQLLVTLEDSFLRNYLISTDNPTALSDLRDITPAIETTLKSWDEEVKNKDEVRVATIKNLQAQKIASSSASLKWAPDETKFMYEKSKIYDLEKDKSYDLPQALNYTWLPDSAHVIMIQEGKVVIAEYDGSNQAVVYAGNFLNNFVAPWPDASKLVIISSVPTPTASAPNLFGVNLK